MKLIDMDLHTRQMLLLMADAVKDKLESLTPRCRNCKNYWNEKCSLAPEEKIPAAVLSTGCDSWSYDTLELLI